MSGGTDYKTRNKDRAGQSELQAGGNAEFCRARQPEKQFGRSGLPAGRSAAWPNGGASGGQKQDTALR
jgi:hypothetical protein